MKHRPRRRFAALLVAATGTATVSLLASCGLSTLEYGPYLRGLEDNCERLTSHLESEGINAHCEEEGWAVIEEAGVKYTLNDSGMRWFETDIAFFSHLGTIKGGKIASFTIMVGGGYDAPKASYPMSDLSKPSAYYWGDDLDWVQRTIEASISTQEMKALVEQAEHYQRLVRTRLDNLK
ncbi:hypothetical protein ABCS02_26380 [Microbacterium sp. X-17]|uniref:hypothetical protein n=1 Tax=Microbacterium sp. X-17 TaxID=3144404 RepID=UPI0031F5A30A